MSGAREQKGGSKPRRGLGLLREGGEAKPGRLPCIADNILFYLYFLLKLLIAYIININL